MTQTLTVAVLGWVLLGWFNVRQFTLNWLENFGRVTRGDLAFFVILGGVMAPVAWPLPLVSFVRRRTNIRFDWSKVVYRSQGK